MKIKIKIRKRIKSKIRSKSRIDPARDSYCIS